MSENMLAKKQPPNKINITTNEPNDKTSDNKDTIKYAFFPTINNAI